MEHMSKRRGPYFFLNPIIDHPLGGPQIVQYPVTEQLPDKIMKIGTDRFRLPQTPLGILHLIGDGFWRHMVIDGLPYPRVFSTGGERPQALDPCRF